MSVDGLGKASGRVARAITMTVASTSRVVDRLVVRQVVHPTHTEWYVTGRPVSDSDAAVAAVEVFEAVANLLVSHGILPLQEKIYGLGRSHPLLLERRAKAFSDRGVVADWPLTILEGIPASGAHFAGVQLRGVTPRPEAGQRVETVVRQGRNVGREWIGPDFRELHLSAIDGDAGESSGLNAAPEQARRMFDAAAAVLSERGYSFRQVVRTWIYLSRILDWYGEFNRVRTRYYEGAGLSTSGNAVFPASTGIGAKCDREECLMDLLAVDTGPKTALVVRPVLKSERQGQPFAYGSAFVRAMVVERRGRKVIHVSGTASIDAEGKSKHAGDAGAQYCETLLGIAAVLEQEGASLTDIAQGTLFAKTPEVVASCREVSRRLGLPPLPLIELVAPVCRPELLVEIEAIAIVEKPGSVSPPVSAITSP
jgi:enamine deaminase RidA (YjgF/YER057c/UK114 family)